MSLASHHIALTTTAADQHLSREPHQLAPWLPPNKAAALHPNSSAPPNLSKVGAFHDIGVLPEPASTPATTTARSVKSKPAGQISYQPALDEHGLRLQDLSNASHRTGNEGRKRRSCGPI